MQKMMNRNKNANLVRMSNRQRNCLRWSTNETWVHLLMKLKVCNALKLMGRDFISEAIFENGLRADVLDLDTGTCFEIVNTEKECSILKKVKDYPLPLIVVNANQEFNEKLIL
jgi:hypothetical protein